MLRFKSLAEAEAAVNDILGNNSRAVCMRYDDGEPGTEVVSVTGSGFYWMVKFYDDGEIAYGMMDWFTNMQFA